MSQPRALRLLSLTTATLAYVAVGWLCLGLAEIHPLVAPVWAPSGIAIATLLFLGIRAWPAVFLGALIVNLAASDAIVTSLFIAAGNAAEAILAALLVTRFAAGRRAFEQGVDIAKFALLAGALAAPVSAGAAVLGLAIGGLTAAGDLAAIGFTWWLSDATGAVIVTPVILLWAGRTPGWTVSRAIETAAAFLFLGVVGLFAFGCVVPLAAPDYPLRLLILPLILWFALRLGPRETATAALLLSVISALGTHLGFAPLGPLPHDIAHLVFQASLAVLSSTFLGVATAVERRRQVEAELRDSVDEYRMVTGTACDAILTIDADSTIRFANPAVERIFGWTPEELVGRNLTVLMPERHRALHLASFRHYQQTGQRHISWTAVELPGLHKDGREVPLELSFGERQHGGRRLFTGIARDISERRRAEERVRYLAEHDELTGLSSRAAFRDRLRQAIAQARDLGRRVAVLLLDLDGFKHINDSLGHEIGDRMLVMTAHRLERCVRPGDALARLGGDEFVLGLADLATPEEAAALAASALASLRPPFPIDPHELHVSGSIGIAVFPEDGDDVGRLLRAADTALYHAKARGRDNFQFFRPQLDAAAQRRLTIANFMHRALQQGEFALEYQPQVDLRSGEIVAAEALLRWRQPELGVIVPAEFIQVAEETGLIGPLGERVVREACGQLRRWHRRGFTRLRMAINLSPAQLRRAGFSDFASRVIRESCVPPESIEFEITEGVLVTQTPEQAVLEELSRSGFQLAVDDFGTGYSSLAYLQRFPVRTLKIDRSFVSGIGRDSDDTTIVNAILAMARSLRLHVVAEGVETAEQAAFLKSRGCPSAQGFLYGTAMPSAAFGRLLRRQAEGPASDLAPTGA